MKRTLSVFSVFVLVLGAAWLALGSVDRTVAGRNGAEWGCRLPT
jgi:hypothetical protein